MIPFFSMTAVWRQLTLALAFGIIPSLLFQVTLALIWFAFTRAGILVPRLLHRIAIACLLDTVTLTCPVVVHGDVFKTLRSSWNSVCSNADLVLVRDCAVRRIRYVGATSGTALKCDVIWDAEYPRVPWYSDSCGSRLTESLVQDFYPIYCKNKPKWRLNACAILRLQPLVLFAAYRWFKIGEFLPSNFF